MPQLPAPIETVLGLDVAQDSVTLHDLVTGRTVTVANTGEALLAALEPLRQRALAVARPPAVMRPCCSAAPRPGHPRPSRRRGQDQRLRALPASGQDRPARCPHPGPLRSRAGRRPGTLDTAARPPGRPHRTRAPTRRSGGGAQGRARPHHRSRRRRHRGLAGPLPRLPGRRDRRAGDRHRRADRRDPAARAAPERADRTARDRQDRRRLALLPELGRLSRRQAAALAGVAPHPDQTGTTRNRGRTIGGRRVFALFLAALTAVRGDNSLSHFYKRLVAAGKPKRLALVAVMRKLVVIANARIADLNTKTLQLT